MSMAEQPLLRLTGVQKYFGAIHALQDVHLEVNSGEVVALVGDNGAGKSTLIKSIAGVQPAEEGIFTFDGTDVTLHSAKASADLGISVVYQDLALCDNLDIQENLFLGREIRRGPMRSLDRARMRARSIELLQSIGVQTIRSLDTEVGLLSGGQRQAIAIARAVLGDPRIVILDEPTAALGVTQTAQVLALVTRLKERGLGVILISHNLADVFEVADRVEVLRLGKNGGSFDATPENHEAVVAAITGVGRGAATGRSAV